MTKTSPPNLYIMNTTYIMKTYLFSSNCQMLSSEVLIIQKLVEKCVHDMTLFNYYNYRVNQLLLKLIFDEADMKRINSFQIEFHEFTNWFKDICNSQQDSIDLVFKDVSYQLNVERLKLNENDQELDLSKLVHKLDLQSKIIHFKFMANQIANMYLNEFDDFENEYLKERLSIKYVIEDLLEENSLKKTDFKTLRDIYKFLHLKDVRSVDDEESK